MGMNGPDPIGWEDIDAFLRRSGSYLDPFQIQMLETIDDEYLASVAADETEDEKQAALREGLKSLAAKRDHIIS